MPKRIIRHLARMLGDRSLSPDSRLVAAILFLGGGHHLHGGIYALCGALREVAHLFPGIGALGISLRKEGYHSKKVETALDEMAKAGFIRWNRRKDQFTVLRDGPARRSFIAEIRMVPSFDTFRRSIAAAGDQLCYFLKAD